GACGGLFFFFSSRRRHTRSDRDWSSDVCSSDLARGLASRTRAHVLWFSRQRPLDYGVFAHDGWLVARLNGHMDRICPLAEVQLRGAHNVENVLAATACALWTGIGVDAIRRAVGRFRAVAHRIEFV